MRDFIFIFIGAMTIWIISGLIAMDYQQEKHIDKINTWAIENGYAQYNNKTGEIIYYCDDLEKIVNKRKLIYGI